MITITKKTFIHKNMEGQNKVKNGQKTGVSQPKLV